MSEFEEYFANYHSNNEAHAETIARDAWNARQSEIDQLKAEVENLKNPSLVLHTKKYREQCEVFESLSDAEKKAYGIGYEWACKVSQQQILTLIQDHESIEDRSDKKIEKLKAEKAVLEKKLKSVYDFEALFEIEKRCNGRLQDRIKKGIRIMDCNERYIPLLAMQSIKKALRGEHE